MDRLTVAQGTQKVTKGWGSLRSREATLGSGHQPPEGGGNLLGSGGTGKRVLCPPLRDTQHSCGAVRLGFTRSGHHRLSKNQVKSRLVYKILCS